MFKVYKLLEATGGRLISGRKDALVRGVSIDSRTIKKGQVFIAIRGEKFDGHDFIGAALKSGASCIICSRFKVQGSKQKAVFIKVRDTTRALGDIARFQRQKFDIPVIAVTGSNGKTTTKDMIAWILSHKLRVLKNEGTKNNQIGLPLTLLNLNKDYDAAVLELGTNHFGEINCLTRICQPNIGIITNIGPAHLEYLRDLKGVFKEKYSLTKGLKRPYIGIMNSDDKFLKHQSTRHTGKSFIVSFGLRGPADFSGSDIRGYGGRIQFVLNQRHRFTLKTLGGFNIYNALAAIAVARLFGLSHKDIAYRLTDFKFPASRLNLIELNEIKFIDDTYNSNPFSLKAALSALANFNNNGRRIFVMGDMLELGAAKKIFHSQAGQLAARSCDIFITIGKLSRLAARQAKFCGFDVGSIFSCESARQARDILFNRIIPKADDIILVKGSRAMKMEDVFKV